MRAKMPLDCTSTTYRLRAMLARMRPLLCLFLLSSCSKTTRPVPPAPAPSTLLVEASASSLSAATRGVAAYADAVKPKSSVLIQPGMAALVLADAAGAAGLDGADLEAPLRLFLLDPKQFQAPVVLLVVVPNDEAKKKLQSSAGDQVQVRVEGNHALVGAKNAVEALAGYALGTLAGKEVPADPTAIVYVPAVWKTFTPEIEEGRKNLSKLFGEPPSGFMSGIFQGYMDVLAALAEQTDRAVVTAHIDGTRGELEIALQARRGTTFAGFIAAQKPLDPSLLARLPAGPAPMVMLVQIQIGPLRQAIDKLLAGVFPGLEVEMAGFFEQFLGGLAMTGTISIVDGAARMSSVYTVKDSRAAVALSRKMIEKLKGQEIALAGQKMRYDVVLGEGTHQGVPITSFQTKVELVGASPEMKEMMERMYEAQGPTVMAPVGSYVVGVNGKDPAAIGRAIDAARAGNGFVPAGAAKQAVDDAVARKESCVFLFDFGTLTGTTSEAPMSMGVGFPAGELRLRISLPPSSLRGLAAGG
jgi:hypothetical protein